MLVSMHARRRVSISPTSGEEEGDASCVSHEAMGDGQSEYEGVVGTEDGVERGDVQSLHSSELDEQEPRSDTGDLDRRSSSSELVVLKLFF